MRARWPHSHAVLTRCVLLHLRIAYQLSRMVFSQYQNRYARRGSMTAEPAPASSPDEGGQVTIVLDRKKVSVPRMANETLLESARRAGLSPPFSCEAGNCGTCMGKL